MTEYSGVTDNVGEVRRQAAGTGRDATAAGSRGAGRSGRRAGESGTREAILDAARRLFSKRGYDGATIRGIAADAGVDPALVHHYYGNKERLFAAAMQLPVVPSEVLAAVFAAEHRRLGDRFAENIGEILVRNLLAVWEVADIRATFLGLLRTAATNDQGVAMLREFVSSTILTALAGLLGPAGKETGTEEGSAEEPGTVRASDAAPAASDTERRYRASLVASQIVGLGFTRYVLALEPIASATTEDLVAAMAPTLQRYLTGDLA
jgi:AcrR family transcriptional regulator